MASLVQCREWTISLSETVVIMAEGGQAGANQGPGKHILAVTSVDTSA